MELNNFLLVEFQLFFFFLVKRHCKWLDFGVHALLFSLQMGVVIWELASQLTF